MIKKSLQAIGTFIVVIALAYPFAREAYSRAAIQRDLIGSFNVGDAVALKEWDGSTESFVKMLEDRCLRANKGDAASCERYRLPRG